jgi:ubiquinone/menaquinone biosynthesis C-methylase UbiE
MYLMMKSIHIVIIKDAIMENQSATSKIEKQLDRSDLEARVKKMYTRVAHDPHGDFHFEMGRELALRLGYTTDELDAIPSESIDSFAGVGYHFGMADIKKGEKVLDLGSGAGMDVFIAAQKAGPRGRVWGVDMTEAQLQKSSNLALHHDFHAVSFISGHIEEFDFIPGSLDVVISNGVINLSSEKGQVFKHIASMLKPGGRMAISDIVTGLQLPSSITCNSSLWAACIGGAMEKGKYNDLIKAAGMEVTSWTKNNEYAFISNSAKGATEEFQVHSISLLAVKPK